MDELKWLDLEKHISFYIVHLAQELASFLREGTDSKYFQVCGSYGLCHYYSTLSLYWESSHRQYKNDGCSPVPIKCYLQKQAVGVFGLWADLLLKFTCSQTLVYIRMTWATCDNKSCPDPRFWFHGFGLGHGAPTIILVPQSQRNAVLHL